MASLTWHHGDQLAVRVGSRIDPVPAPLDYLLASAELIELTADAAVDLIQLDARLTALAQTLRRDVDQAERALRDARHRHAQPHPQHQRPRSLSDRTRDHTLETTLAHHNQAAEQLDDIRTVTEVLREFVNGLDLAAGLLRDVAEGWNRDPAPPATAQIYADESTFVTVDTRRARHQGWGTPTIDGIEFGTGWRRDPDDEFTETEPTYMSGTWTLGYLARTAEVYAVRRSPTRPSAVWVLATLPTVEAMNAAVDPILPRMRTPNSMSLAAATLHQAQTAHATRAAPA
ncbi:hypothetical protein [Actinokineospora enzanensis]|uniref:hypothetical protein n=1 Tax=Actinokineospora enzanensis TaxID=155975 RepID=UPI0003694AE3|nr:hypothetical protein [Actinokineospora enzanensis]